MAHTATSEGAIEQDCYGVFEQLKGSAAATTIG
jgi:hypothetical protein